MVCLGCWFFYFFGNEEMSARRNRFLATTCLGFIGLSTLTFVQPAFAGFEWTPPEKQAPAPIPDRLPLPPMESEESSALPEVEGVDIPDEQSSQQVMPEPVQNQQEPRLKVKVMAPPQEPVDNGPAVMSAPILPANIPQQPAPEPFPITETHQGTDTIMPEPGHTVSEAAPSPQEGPHGVSINPYPLEETDHTEPQLTSSPMTPPPGEDIAWKKGSYEVVEGFGSDMPLALALRQVVPADYAFSFGRGVNPGYLVSWEGGKPWNQVLNDMVQPLNIQARIEGNVVKIVSSMAPVAEPAPSVNEGDLSPLPEAETPHASIEPDIQPQPEEAEIKVGDFTEKDAKNMAKEAKNLQDNTEIEAAEAQQEEPVNVASLETENEPAEETPSDISASQLKKRDVILDPGDIKPAAPAHQEKSMDKVKEKTAKADTLVPSISSEDAVKSADVKPAASSSNEQMFQPRIWEAKQGSSLKQTLDDWARQANVPLQWNTDKDYTLSSNILISGTFDNAVKVLFAQAVKNGPVHNLQTEPEAALVIGDEASG